MSKTTKEEQKDITEKLKKIKLDIDNIPDIFRIEKKVEYKPLQEYDNTNYKIYHYVDVMDIEIYLTPTTRLEETIVKYKKAEPLTNYLQPDNKELIGNYIKFIELLKQLDMEKLKKLEKQQKEFNKEKPYQIKYKDNFIWEIYYSELDDKYFMMFPTDEGQVESLFFLIKKQIELKKSKKREMIYVPINNMQYTSGILKKSEIADLENYLWYFTKDWPVVYEIQNKEKTKSLQVIGNVEIYDRIKSNYKMVFNTKEEAQEYFKLIKALFILESNAEEEYKFKALINEKGNLSFYLNHNEIKYNNLSEFIKNEVYNKKQKLIQVSNANLLNTERLVTLKEIIAKQNIEYLAKEKQIALYLKCKKSFFGRINYFFKSKKKKKEVIYKSENINQENVKIKQQEKFEEKDLYTIEDLLKICTILQKEEKELKNKELDIKALENKEENLERKIKNATIYINEIESHKKSIFDFWKFTNKDEVPLLTESEKNDMNGENEKLKKVFSYDEDIEKVGKKIDGIQRNIFSEKECDAIFAIYNDLNSFKIDRKEKKLKKDEKIVENSLKQKKMEYEQDYDTLKEKDFDIFGSLSEDNTKIKTLNNQKHREIEKDKYQVLDIHPNTTVKEYEDNIHHFEKILEGAYNKMVSPYDIKLFKAAKEELIDKNWIIMNMNSEKEINNFLQEKSENIILNCINLKENMPAIFYSNIMFYENLNKTLPEGMDISQCVLLDLKQCEFKLIGRKDFYINFEKNEYENEIKLVQLYEYSLENEK